MYGRYDILAAKAIECGDANHRVAVQPCVLAVHTQDKNVAHGADRRANVCV